MDDDPYDVPVKLKLKMERQPPLAKIPCRLCGDGIYQHEHRVVCHRCTLYSGRRSSLYARGLRNWKLNSDLCEAETALMALRKEITSCKMTQR